MRMSAFWPVDEPKHPWGRLTRLTASRSAMTDLVQINRQMLRVAGKVRVRRKDPQAVPHRYGADQQVH
jgi:hypothetical protein